MKAYQALGALLAAGTLMWPAAGDARSGMMCGDRAKVAAGLATQYSEQPISMGLASNGGVIEVFASKTGSFTIMITAPNGVSCLMAAGKHWELMKPKVLGAQS